jgi:heme exporter protein C
MSMFVYVAMAVAAAIGLVWRMKLAHAVAACCAPIGASFTFLALVTGSIWGKPMWGTWWVWDARLTSVLILFFFYLGHMALAHAFDDPQRGRRAAAILAIAGFINVPVVKFSVDWWNTLHQPASIFRAGGPTLDAAMLWPLGIMALAYLLFFIAVLLVRMHAALLRARVRVLQIAQLDAAPAALRG